MFWRTSFHQQPLSKHGRSLFGGCDVDMSHMFSIVLPHRSWHFCWICSWEPTWRLGRNPLRWIFDHLQMTMEPSQKPPNPLDNLRSPRRPMTNVDLFPISCPAGHFCIYWVSGLSRVGLRKGCPLWDSETVFPMGLGWRSSRGVAQGSRSAMFRSCLETYMLSTWCTCMVSRYFSIFWPTKILRMSVFTHNICLMVFCVETHCEGWLCHTGVPR